MTHDDLKFLYTYIFEVLETAPSRSHVDAIKNYTPESIKEDATVYGWGSDIVKDDFCEWLRDQLHAED